MKKIKQKIAELLVLVLLFSMISMNIMPVSAEGDEGTSTSFAAGTVRETAPEIAELGLTVGSGLIDTYLAADDTILCRDDEGWAQDADAWSWGLPKSGWSWWNTGSTTAAVTGANTLSLTATDTDAVILLPTLPAANYKLEATFTVVGTQDGETVTTPNGSFGLVTNINPSYADSTVAPDSERIRPGTSKVRIITACLYTTRPVKRTIIMNHRPT